MINKNCYCCEKPLIKCSKNNTFPKYCHSCREAIKNLYFKRIQGLYIKCAKEIRKKFLKEKPAEEPVYKVVGGQTYSSI